MSLTEQVLAACVAVAAKNNHGHMTGYHVWVMMNNMGSRVGMPIISSMLSKNQSWWRQGLPRKQKSGWLIRELQEELWQKNAGATGDVEDVIKDLRYELRNVLKERDATSARHFALTIENAQLTQELAKLRSIWRELNNAMNPGR